MAEGFAMLIADCAGCGAVGMFHPHKAPSIRLNDQGKPDPCGDRFPICLACFDRWNQIHRIDNGLDPIKLQPGAYGAFSEGEL